MRPGPDQPAPGAARNLPWDRRLQGWARSPEGSGLLGRERARPRAPRRPARRGEKGHGVLAPSSELEPGAAWAPPPQSLRGARGILASFHVSSAETRRGRRLPFQTGPFGFSLPHAQAEPAFLGRLGPNS